MRTINADVVVVGLGAMGSQTLWRLAHRGVDVVGVEQFDIGHSRGASHGGSRIIRTAYAEGAAYVPLLLDSWRLWAELEKESGTTLLDRTGGLMLGREDSPAITGSIASAEEHGLKYNVLNARELHRLYPQHRVAEDMMAVFEYDAGVVYPEKAVHAAVDAAVALGAQVVRGEAVEVEPGRVGLADGTTLTARHVVVAGGGWTPRLVPGLAPHVRVVRRVVGWFAATAAYAADRFPVFIRMDESWEHNWYGFPAIDGAVKLGLHAWPGIDEPVDPRAGVRPADALDAARLGDIVAGTLPGVDPRPLRMATCMYSLTPDRHFLVGARDGLTVLGGFSGHGFKLAPAIGEAAAGLAVDGGSALAIDLFDPRRFDDPGR
ncbi:N-methyl-L-tryptophan oxidase [Longispora sp. NPDC051575]|uniref:N-methyl-L-tryptophan oxidase n=1 Tax=Longispora sp. NPDC051575 TaxID=3154943 RepID=UPI003421BFE9